MRLLTAHMRMAEVIESNHLLIPVMNRLGIRLGFGDKTVKTVCAEAGVDTEFFLAVVNTFNNEEFLPQKKLRGFNVLMIVDYLERTHSYYIDVQVPLIEKRINELLRRCARRNPRLKLIRRFFLGYKKELFAHLRREETTTFPYIREVHALSRGGGRRRKPRLGGYSMEVYEAEHNNVDDKLDDLKNILIKYIKGEFDAGMVNVIIFELFRLEKDIEDHTRIEEHILRPMVGDMEAALASRAG